MRALGTLFLSFVFLTSLYFVSSRFMSGVSIEPQVLASSNELNQTQRLFLSKINAIRSEGGVNQLSYNTDIEKLTDYRVSDMSSREYYSHRTPDGVTYANYLNDYSIETEFSCENLQLQMGPNMNEAINAWENSSSHYSCLVNPKINYVAFSYEPYMREVNETDDDTTFVFAMIATD